jgi:hypothetical protein
MQAVNALYENIIEPSFSYLGLAHSQLRRFTAVAGTTALATWIFKPQYLFDETGKPRPWSFNPKNYEAVPINWLMVSILVGGFSVLFI